MNFIENSHHNNIPTRSSFVEGVIGDFTVGNNPKSEKPVSAAVGFLGDVDPRFRRELLAFHESHCLHEKHKLCIQHYLEAEIEAEVELEVASKGGFAALQSLRNCPTALSIRAELEDCQSVPMVPGSLVSSLHDDDKEESMSKDDDSDVDGEKPPNVIQMDESWILQLTVYERILEQFQHFYNNHDSVGLSSLFTLPFCHPSVVRAVNFWCHPHCNRISSSSRDMYGDHHSDCLEEGQLATLSNNALDGLQPLLLRSSRMEGADVIVSAFKTIFQNFPDCLIIFHSTRIQAVNDRQLVVLRASYTYFFKMVVRSNSFNYPTCNSSIMNSNFLDPFQLVDVELKGNLELHFSVGNVVNFIADHVMSCSTSDKNISQDQVLKYLGY